MNRVDVVDLVVDLVDVNLDIDLVCVALHVDLVDVDLVDILFDVLLMSLRRQFLSKISFLFFYNAPQMRKTRVFTSPDLKGS